MLFRLIGTIGTLIWIAVIIGFIVLLRKNNKRFRRSSVNRKICGVCGGIGECLDVDPTIVRLVWVLVTICGGSGILAYIIALLVMSD